MNIVHSFWAEKPEHLSDFEDPSISPLQDIWVVFCSAHAAWILLPVFLVPVGGLAANYDRHLQQERGTKMSKACWNFIFTKFFRGSQHIPGNIWILSEQQDAFCFGEEKCREFPDQLFSKSPTVTLLVLADLWWWFFVEQTRQINQIEGSAMTQNRKFFLLKKGLPPSTNCWVRAGLLPPCCCRILLRADGDRSIMKFDRMIPLDFEDPTTLDPCALKTKSDIKNNIKKQAFHQKNVFRYENPFWKHYCNKR